VERRPDDAAAVTGDELGQVGGDVDRAGEALVAAARAEARA
jgi:hypothetical protein